MRTPKTLKSLPSLSSAELGRYLLRMADVNKDQKTGNLVLSAALEELAAFLTAHRSTPIHQLTLDLRTERPSKTVEATFKEKTDIPLSEVSKILSDPSTTKEEAMYLGRERFGISISKLRKIPRDAVLRTLWAAHDHEQSIAIITDEAKRGGQDRTS
jgi:hypothetical protein